MSKLCTICARGGSVGVKNKNIRVMAGKPLIAHSIAQAKQSELFDLVAVSSDSDEILRVAKEWGADFLIKRPDELANSAAAKIPAIQHAVKTVEDHFNKRFSVLVDLDATSPLRKVEDIKGAVEMLETAKANNIITAAPSRRSPYFTMVELDEHGVVRLCKPLDKAVVRRQDAPKTYDMNAAVYVWQHDSLFSSDKLFNDKTFLFVMPEERSLDIDTELDFELVEYLMLKQLNNQEN
ncbi:MAG: flagellar modification protein [Gammaproteobacteria bacterium]|jgi:N-acylneuraminate cytidylyltransferase/CMP-N,N'-diacetyllegionaminic acid synthase|nr:flagellar modification protein [Gammaproteobacteria bacterium]